MVRFTRIVLILFITNLFGFANAKSPPPGTGTSDIPANILIMLDNSGSMSARLGGSTSIHYPVDVNVDSNGNIYVLEYWNNRIKKFDSSGNFLKSFGGSGKSLKTLHVNFVLGMRTAQAVTNIATKYI